jgi:hypothetical protein
MNTAKRPAEFAVAAFPAMFFLNCCMSNFCHLYNLTNGIPLTSPPPFPNRIASLSKYSLKGKKSPAIFLPIDSNTLSSKYHPEYASPDEGNAAQPERRADCHESYRRQEIGVATLACDSYG